MGLNASIAGNVGQIIGTKEIIANIQRRRRWMETSFQLGMERASKILLTESQKLVPVEYGELKASGFVGRSGRGFKADFTVGYTAPYAGFVHEMVEMKLKGQPRPSGIGNYWDPAGARAKFLEIPMNKDSIRAKMRAEIKKALTV